MANCIGGGVGTGVGTGVGELVGSAVDGWLVGPDVCRFVGA